MTCGRRAKSLFLRSENGSISRALQCGISICIRVWPAKAPIRMRWSMQLASAPDTKATAVFTVGAPTIGLTRASSIGNAEHVGPHGGGNFDHRDACPGALAHLRCRDLDHHSPVRSHS